MRRLARRPGAARPGRRAAIVLAFGTAAGVAMGSVASLIAAYAVEATGTAAFCGSCHEMTVMCETWQTSAHGPAAKGAAKASCTDCHLPHDDLVHYLAMKGVTGTKDVVYHVLGREPDWVANLARREVYTYESGCQQCHVDLVTPGIPLKAYLAHRDYRTGEATASCVGCHSEVGHGNLRLTLMKQDGRRIAMRQPGAPQRASGGVAEERK